MNQMTEQQYQRTLPKDGTEVAHLMKKGLLTFDEMMLFRTYQTFRDPETGKYSIPGAEEILSRLKEVLQRDRLYCQAVLKKIGQDYEHTLTDEKWSRWLDERRQK